MIDYSKPMSADNVELQVGDRVRATKWIAAHMTGWLGTVKEVAPSFGLGEPIPNCINVEFDNEPGHTQGFAAQIVEFVERP